MTEDLMSRPLPSLAEWLGDGDRAEGFEGWVRHTVFMAEAAADDDQAAASRILQTLSIAMIETCRTEAEHHGRDFVQTVCALARISGVAAMAAVMSPLDDEKAPPLEKIVKLITEEFRHGARMMAEAAERQGEAA